MLDKPIADAIDLILATTEDGLRYVEEHPELSSHQAAAAGGAGITSLPSKYRMTADTVAALRGSLKAIDDGPNPNEEAARLFEAIKHGSTTHRAWLYDALTAYFNGKPVPASDAPLVLDEPLVGNGDDTKASANNTVLNADIE